MLIYILMYAFAKLNHILFTVVLHYLLTMMRIFKVLFVLSEFMLPNQFVNNY